MQQGGKVRYATTCMFVCLVNNTTLQKKETGKSHCPQGILAIANAEGAPMETSWVNYYSRLLLVISYNLLLKSFYTAQQSFWLYLQLSYRSSVKYKKNSEIISAVLQWFQICIILTPGD